MKSFAYIVTGVSLALGVAQTYLLWEILRAVS